MTPTSPRQDHATVISTAEVVRALTPALVDRPPAGVPVVEHPDHSDDERAAHDIVGDRAFRWAARVAVNTADLVVRANQDHPEMPAQEIARAARAMLLEMLRELCGQRASVRLTEDQREIVRDTVGRDLPFERIVSSLRMVQAHWTDLLLARVPPPGPDVLREIVQIAAHYFDRVVDGVISEYLRQSERRLTGRAAERAALVEAVMAGQDVDEELIRTRLGIDLDVTVVGLVLRGLRPGAPAYRRDELRRTADAVTRAAEATAAVLHPVADDELWLWVGRSLHMARRHVDWDALDALARNRGQRLAVGAPRTGRHGMRRTLVEARSVSRLRLRAGPGVVHHTQVDLAALLGNDRERAAWFVEDHLGPLAGNDTAAAELRETLNRYYACGMSLVAAAGPLHVHRNTVVYRLRRIEQLLGHPVTEKVPQVRCALLLVAEFGDEMLVTPPPEPTSGVGAPAM